MNPAIHDNKLISIEIGSRALGDTICAIPTIRKISNAYNGSLTIFSRFPFLFEKHPLVAKSLPIDSNKDGYKVYKTFDHLLGKHHKIDGNDIEFRHPNIDIRQFHAISLGFALTEDEMECDLYIEDPLELPFRDYVIIHPTHTWATRTWSQENWQSLTDKLASVGIPVVLVGQDGREVGFFNTDKPTMNIKFKYGTSLMNDDRSTVGSLRWMMNNRAKVVVTMDSGILHIAGTTDVNIIQLGSSITPRIRSPYRNGSQSYKYTYIGGSCKEFCSSNMKYNIMEWGTIQAVPPMVKCLMNKKSFECHPSVDDVFNQIFKLYTNEVLSQR